MRLVIVSLFITTTSFCMHSRYIPIKNEDNKNFSPIGASALYFRAPVFENTSDKDASDFFMSKARQVLNDSIELLEEETKENIEKGDIRIEQKLKEAKKKLKEESKDETVTLSKSALYAAKGINLVIRMQKSGTFSPICRDQLRKSIP